MRGKLQRGSPLDLGKSEIPNEQPTLWWGEATASSRGKGCSACKCCPGLTKACGKSPCEHSPIDLAAAKFGNKSTFCGSCSKSDEACPVRVWSPLQECTRFVCGSELACAEEELVLKLSGTNLRVLILSWVRSQEFVSAFWGLHHSASL